MDNPQNIVCCGCLSIGRKMIKIDLERKECFHQILGDLQTVADFKLMYLCWECTSRLSNFIKFKSQVRYAHKCLQDIEKDLKLVSQSKLNTQNTLIINYDPETSEELDWHIAASEEKETPSDQQCSETETVVQPKKKIKKASKSKRLMHLYKEIELTESDIEAERDTEASSDSFVNALFKCEKCVEAFPNQEDLNDHNLKKHNKLSGVRVLFRNRSGSFVPREQAQDPLSVQVVPHEVRDQIEGAITPRPGTQLETG